MYATDYKCLRNKEISVITCAHRWIYKGRRCWEMSRIWTGRKKGRDLRKYETWLIQVHKY